MRNIKFSQLNNNITKLPGGPGLVKYNSYDIIDKKLIRRWDSERELSLRKFTFFLFFLVGCVAQLAERRSLAGELTLSCARPAADG